MSKFRIIEVGGFYKNVVTGLPMPPTPPFEVMVRYEGSTVHEFFDVYPKSPGLAALEDARESGQILELTLTPGADGKTIVDVVWTETGKSLIHP